VEVSEPAEIVPGIYSTGEVKGGIIEQALVVTSAQGLVVITGCAHPGIVRMVEQAQDVAKDDIYLVLGGFHLGGKSKAQISRIVADFRRLGVQKAAPCHCSGDKARELFAEEYGDDYVLNGVGWKMSIPQQ
jgi:7,8-dihydropterin-6-yl-methyl-4-(beta-D-ribofuranosyl)aminobenzene 5'-phosphate synthase